MTEELTDLELLEATDEDWAYYKQIIEGLPTMAGKNNDGLDKFGVPIPYHSGPHILRHFRDTIELAKPNGILEIGFNMGHSSAMWLALSNAQVVSCDVSEKDETLEGVHFLIKKYYNEKNHFMRFFYHNRNNPSFMQHVTNVPFDLAFIDGAHDEQSIITDIELCKELVIPYLLFDDWYPRFGETQKAVAKFPELELVKDMNNLMLYKWNG